MKCDLVSLFVPKQFGSVGFQHQIVLFSHSSLSNDTFVISLKVH